MDGQFRSIYVGGAFSVLIDVDNKAYLWGSQSDSSSPLMTPNVISTIEGKQIVSGAVGD
jgi:hypothetical protein